MTNETIKNNFQTNFYNFVKKNLKLLIIILVTIFIFLLIFIFIQNIKKKNEIRLSDEYIQATILISQKKMTESKLLLESIINKKHNFYSPLALYLIIENNIEAEPLNIINFFDIILKNNSIDTENLNLIKIKKAIYLLDQNNEKLIIETLNPVINSESTWRNMAINIIVEYFLSKDQNSKANKYTELLKNKINK